MSTSNIPPQDTLRVPSPNPAAAPTDGSTDPLNPSEGEESDTAPTVPFPTKPSSTTVFKINSTGPFGRTLHITSSPNGQQLFTCALHSISRPHVIMSNAAGETVGTITFHPFSRKISITTHPNTPTQHDFEITHTGVFKSRYSFPSPALKNEKLEWQGGSTSVLVNGKGNAVARFESTRLAAWKERTVEVVEGGVGGGGGSGGGGEGGGGAEGKEREGEGEGGEKQLLLVEVLISAVAIMELRRRRAKNSGGGGGGTGGTG